MFYNNNIEGTLKLSKRVYKRSYIRNLMIILAIILTTILVTANIRNLLVIGEINKNYGGYTSKNKVDKALDLEWSDIKVDGIGQYNISNYEPNIKEKFDRNVFLVAKNLEELQEELKGRYITGKFPTKPDEIMIPSWMLMNIDSNASNIRIMLNTSRVESSAKGEEVKAFSRFYHVVGIYEEEKIDENSFSKIYYYPKVMESNISVILLVFLVVTLISGYLLINNIFYISVVKDTKLFGLLKTIGLTSKGIENIIYYGAVINSLVGIPIGLYLGIIVSNKLTPVIFNLSSVKIGEYKINEPFVCFISTIFVLITVWFCAREPKIYAKKVSPIEACKFDYCEKANINSVRKLKEKNILKRIAIFNMFGNERKTFLTIFSICISGVTFILSLCFYFSFKPVNFIEDGYKKDYAITLKEPFISGEEFKEYSSEFLSKIENLEEIKNLQIKYEKRSESLSYNPLYSGNLLNNDYFKNMMKDTEKYAKTITFDLKNGVNKERFEEKIRALVLEENNPIIRLDSKYKAMENAISIRSGIFTVGMVISFLIGLIGFISSINTMLTSIFTRNIEFALFESIGMTKKQQRRMLIEEGNYFTLYASFFIVPISFVVTLYSSTAFSDYQGYNFLVYLGALLLTILIVYLIMSIIPIICYRYLKNKTVVDRIRSVEY